MPSIRLAAPFAKRALRCALLLPLLALSACTIQFSPGDAKPAGYTPYGMPSGYGEWWDDSGTRNAAGTQPR